MPLPAMPLAVSATARALRRHPQIVATPSVASERREPFGDGNSKRDPGARRFRLTGERLNCPPPAVRGLAKIAPRRAASAAAAASSPYANGITVAPRSTETLTAVEKDSTSTIMKTLADAFQASIPAEPHSQITFGMGR